uniref:Uncharacterized protein n=1 Tax=Tanacetum cinerariifolium TaxID=118510 RepID=A0A6L2MA60_TANCI|nr:hypothetical protein [Tanacetum cinerariifolium]
MPPRVMTRSAGRLVAELRGGRMGEQVGRGGRGRRPREGNDEHADDLNGQGNDQRMGANGGVKGVKGNVEGVNGGTPDFSMIITQQLQNILLAMLAQVGNQRNVGNCHTPDGAWTEYVSRGVTLLCISSTKHKERPLRNKSLDKLVRATDFTEVKQTASMLST